jgi:hypothetical protein
MTDLHRLKDWKHFERLCADLLEAEGFQIEEEPSVDTTGIDIVATCEYRAHAQNLKPIKVRWLVQCKHLAPSGRNLNRQELAEILTNYWARRGANDALLVMISSDYTEPAMRSVQDAIKDKVGAEVMIWNGRQIVALLERHPYLINRYGLAATTDTASTPKLILPNTPDRPVLIISDQSALAHDLHNYLQSAGLHVIFLPVWNYLSEHRLDQFLGAYSATRFALIALFLGDSFGAHFPVQLERLLLRNVSDGGSLLLFPFVAWSIANGRLANLANITPVKLDDNPIPEATSSRNRTLAETFFAIVKSELSFEEDEYREFDLQSVQGQIRAGSKGRFGISHSFEHLKPSKGATIVALRDTLNNPFLVYSTNKNAKIAYLNTCCHTCLSPQTSTAIPSPLTYSHEFRGVMSDLLAWLLSDKEHY